MKRFLLAALACALICCAFQVEAQPRAAAQTTETQRAFVYGINAAVPGNFVGTFAPPSAGTIFLLAGSPSIISPRITEIYFWPITNEYRANWNTLNEAVPGVLEVSRNGSVVAELEPTDYTIHFTQEQTQQTTSTSAELFLGPEAIDAEARFRARQDAFQEAAHAYNEAERAWLDAAAEVNARREAGESVDLPPAPERPAPIGIFSNGLNQGIPIDLGPGQYAIRLRGDDGETVPGSERALTVFAARRHGVGYTVVPETRWTTPLDSPAPSDVIVGEAGSTIYLEPHQAYEYPALAWTRLQNPQRPGEGAGGWEWVNGEPLTTGSLEVIAGGRVVDTRSLTPYNVEQSPGGQLGYEVVEYDAADEGASAAPSFEAYPFRLDDRGQRFDIRLVSDQGQLLPGSDRMVRAPQDPPLSRLLLLPVVPVALGALLITRRQRQVKLPRSAAE
jgi:hypothetical protein